VSQVQPNFFAVVLVFNDGVALHCILIKPVIHNLSIRLLGQWGGNRRGERGEKILTQKLLEECAAHSFLMARLRKQ